MYSGPLFIASDHGGYHLKNRLVRFTQNELNRDITDLGPAEYIETDDYPDFAFLVANKVAETGGRGIVLCSSGIGVCVAANKVKGIRAGIGYNISVAESMVKDDDTNVLCLGSKMISEDHAMAIVKKWLETEFPGAERHVRRIAKIHAAEK